MEITKSGFDWLSDAQTNLKKSLPVMGEMAATLTFAKFVLLPVSGINLTLLKWTDRVTDLYSFDFSDFIPMNLPAEFLEKNEDETPLQSSWRIRLESVGDAATFQFFTREKWSQEEIYTCAVSLDSLSIRSRSLTKTTENQPAES